MIEEKINPITKQITKQFTKQIAIMIVEDDPVTRIGTTIVLEGIENFKLVAQVADGQEALWAVQKHKPDVVLMDIGLPKIDGIEATRKIRELNFDTSILMFTSKNDEKDIFAAIKAGADGYIMKGANPDTLVNAIESVAQKAAWLDPLIARVVLATVQNDSTPSKNKHEAVKKYGLTKKELEVLALIVDGLTDKEISQKLVVSLSTTKAHVHNILQKLYTENRTKGAICALKEGLV